MGNTADFRNVKTKGQVGGQQDIDVRRKQANEAFNRLLSNNLGLYPTGIVYSDVTNERMSASLRDMIKGTGIDDNTLEVRVVYDPRFDQVIESSRRRSRGGKRVVNLQPFKFFLVLKKNSPLLDASKSQDTFLAIGKLNTIQRWTLELKLNAGVAKVLAPFMPRRANDISKIVRKLGFVVYELDANVCMKYLFGIDKDARNIGFDIIDVIIPEHEREDVKGTIFSAKIGVYNINQRRKPNRELDKAFNMGVTHKTVWGNRN